MKERIQIILKLILSHFLPLIGLLVLSILVIENVFLIIVITQTVLLIIFFAGYWEFFGIKFKWLFCSSIQILLLIIFINQLISGVAASSYNIWFIILLIIQVFFLWILAKIITVIFKHDKESIEITFPFKDGSYLVTDGGNSKVSRLMNYHFHSPVHKKKNTNKSMLYATDIVKISKKHTSFIPKTREEYAIFSENVYSPFEGTIVKTVDDIDDNLPFAGNYPYNTGNTIVIKSDHYYFLLGHLKKGSLKVKLGDNVKRNDLLAAAGSSGMSERPHIHMQLIQSKDDDYWKGSGICITFKNKNLYKNRLVKI